MERNNVASSNISSIGYDPQTSTLEVEFLNGGIYQYYGVPENMYQQLMSAPSKGQFLNTYIKNQYAFSRTG
ncbi:MAG: KTSC domain-containing protein [Terracidiphilus sp.]|jgi:hypothetical protein